MALDRDSVEVKAFQNQSWIISKIKVNKIYIFGIYVFKIFEKNFEIVHDKIVK